MVIAIDYDGTLADTNALKVRWIRERLGLEIAPWLCSRTECVPLIGRAYEEMGEEVYGRESTLAASPVPGAPEAIRTLALQAELHVVTARPLRRLAFAREWLERQGLLTCFRGLHSTADTSKAAVCTLLGAGALIDDDVRHLQGVHLPGLRRILLQNGRREAPALEEDIRFCAGWPEVLVVLRIPV